MNTFMKHKQTPVTVLLLAGLIGSSTLAAQEEPDRVDMPRPSTDIASCQDVEWNTSLLTRYPWVKESCHEVIVVDGQNWARFEAEFEGMNRDGTFDVDFLNRRGRSQGVVSLKPRPNQTVLLDNREYAFSDLRDNQKLNFYVPDGAFGFAIEPGAAPEELVEVVEPRTPAAEPVRLAQAEPRPASRATTLPATAGPLPLFALGGLFAMLAGLGMTMRRRSAGSND
ncbi:MAG: LPXTG cell wall anchor domain-containing protein [Wenzhouxiangellaceae bacterium]